MSLQSAGQSSNGSGTKGLTKSDAMQAEMERIAKGIVEEFEEEMEPVMRGLKEARNILPNLDDLIDEERGFGLEGGVWERRGWREIEKFRKVLEDLKELRDLVRTLGRSGGRGPKRKARAHV